MRKAVLPGRGSAQFMGLMSTHKQRIVGDENVVRAKVDCINKADESDFRLRREFGQYLVASLADFLLLR